MRTRTSAQRHPGFTDSVAQTTVPHALLRSDPDPFSGRPIGPQADEPPRPAAPGVLGGSWMGVDDNEAELDQGAHIDGAEVREIDVAGWSFQALGLSRFAAQDARRWPAQFVASGPAYLRVWGLNLLLTVLSLGLYYPWARSSRLQYMYAHTLMGGQPLGYCGAPQRVARGMAGLLLAALVAGAAVWVSPWGSLAAALALVAIGPAVVFVRMRFRLTHTTWQRLRFGFGGTLGGAYASHALPLALLALPAALLDQLARQPALQAGPDAVSAASGMGAALGSPELAAGLLPALDARDLIGWAAAGMWALLVLGAPLFWWVAARYHYGNLRLGPLRTEWRVTLRQAYRVVSPVVLATLAWGGLVAVAAVWLMRLDLGVPEAGAGQPLAVLLLGCVAWMLLVALVGALVRAYAQVRLQNLGWSHTGNCYLRFRSALELGPYAVLMLRGRLLGLLTLGLYHPWAAVARQQMRVRAFSVVSRLVPDEFVGVVGGRPSQFTYDDRPGKGRNAADELLGLRIGW